MMVYLYIRDALPPLHLAGTLSLSQFGWLDPKPSHHAAPFPSMVASGVEVMVM